MRRIATGVALICAVGLLSACGSSGGSKTSSSNPPSRPSSSHSAPAKVGPLTYTPETAATASATVTPTKGGTIKATATDGTTYTLKVAAYQVTKPVTISLVPLGNVAGIPSDQPISAVKMLPSGLTFSNGPAELTIVPAKPLPAATQTMFLADDNGKSLGLALVNPQSKSMTMAVPHFTIAAAASLTPGSAGALALTNYENIFAETRAKLADLLGKERQAQLLGADANSSVIDSLKDDFARVQAALDAAIAANLDNCDVSQQLAAADLGMERQRQLLGIDIGGTDLTKITGSIAKIYKACEKKAIKQCQDADDPAKLIAFWLGVLRQQALLGGSDSTLPDGSQPSVDRANHWCVSFDITGSAGPVTISGHTDDIRKPFTVQVSSPGASGDATATPNANFRSGKVHGVSHAATFNEITDGSYTLTKTDTGYSGKGTIKTCTDLAHQCSGSGLMRLTFTRPQP